MREEKRVKGGGGVVTYWLGACLFLHSFWGDLPVIGD